MANSRSGKRHYLLLYRQQLGQYRLPALLTAIAFGILWWFSPPAIVSDNPQISLAMQAALLIATLAALALFIYAVIGPKLAYVQCFPNYLHISTPLYRLNISYSRIRTCRPQKFSPANVPSGQREIIKPLLGRTAIVIDLNQYPLGEKLLRLLLNRFMFAEDAVGFVFHTADWMALSRDIDTYRIQWKANST